MTRSAWWKHGHVLLLLALALLLVPLERSIGDLAWLQEGLQDSLRLSLTSLRWATLAFVVARIGGWLLVDLVLQRHYQEQMPKLIKDVFSFVIYLAALALLLHRVFEIPVTGLVATTGAMGMVIGFALRDMISDVFSGIAINLDRTFKIGDVIKLRSGFTGIVQEINWRTTRLLSPEGITSVIPNGQISIMEVHIYNKPQRAWRADTDLHLDYSIPTERALRILNAAVRRVDQSVNRELANVQLAGVDERGVCYRAYYWVQKLEDWMPLRSQVIACLMEDLYHAGLTPVRPRQELFLGRMPEYKLDPGQKSRMMLNRVPLLQQLEPDELEQLIAHVEPKVLPGGSRVVEEGDEGNSFFVVTEGLLHVLARKENRSRPILVGSIRAGECFGEFSLLTGERRSATVEAVTDCVIYEIQQGHIAAILEQRPQLARILSDLLAERRLQSQEVLDSSIALRQSKELSELIFEKMSRMFSFLHR